MMAVLKTIFSFWRHGYNYWYVAAMPVKIRMRTERNRTYKRNMKLGLKTNFTQAETMRVFLFFSEKKFNLREIYI
jgi:hypothetical protein